MSKQNAPYNKFSTNRSPIIQVDHLGTRFGSQIVHKNLNLDIYPGEVIGIVGGSGSGKSVLM